MKMNKQQAKERAYWLMNQSTNGYEATRTIFIELYNLFEKFDLDMAEIDHMLETHTISKNGSLIKVEDE